MVMGRAGGSLKGCIVANVNRILGMANGWAKVECPVGTHQSSFLAPEPRSFKAWVCTFLPHILIWCNPLQQDAGGCGMWPPEGCWDQQRHLQ